MKEIAVICWHMSVERFSGYSNAFGLYNFLSDNFKINIIIPREFPFFSEEVQYVNPNMTKRNICLEVPEKEYSDHWAFYKSISENITQKDKEKLKDAISGADLIVCDAVFYVSMIKSIFPDRKVIFRSLDVEYDKIVWAINLHHCKKSLLKSTYEFEKKAYEDADLVFALTQNDIDSIVGLYKVDSYKFKILPICSANVDIVSGYIPCKRAKSKITKGILISAAMIDNGEMILNKVEKIKDFELHIVGRGGLLLKEVPSNVIVHGVVSEQEKNKLLAECDFALNISEMTFGVRTKISDYFLMGIPVISNRIGLTGYNAEENIDYLSCTYETLDNDITKFCNMDTEERYKLALNAFRNYCNYNNYNNYVHLFFENLDMEEDKNKCFIFGTKMTAKNAFLELCNNNYECIGFIDNDISRHDEKYCERMIYSFSEALEIIEKSSEKIKIVIAVSFRYVEEIYKQVSGYIKEEDIQIFEYF